MDALKPRERLLGPALRTQPDRRLVALARDGSAPAQEEIVRRYRAALVRFAGSIVGPAAAEDVVQEALAKSVAALGGAGEELQLRPWLYAIVRNTALNHLRDAGPRTELLDENYDGVEQPPQALERREGVRSLLSGIRGLPQQQREAIVKRELEGRSHDEIATELGVSKGAARQLIFRAREALRIGFGSLLPMPLLRWLAEGGAGDAAVGAAAGAGGGALAAKAAVAVFAAGAAVTAGVAIDHGARQRPVEPPAAEAAVRPATVAPAQGAAVTDPVVATAGGDESSSGSGPGGGDSSGPGSGSDRSGRGDDDGGGHSGKGGPGPSDLSGGPGGEDGFVAEDFADDSGGHGERSGHGGPGHSGRGGDDNSGSSHGGRGSSHSGDDRVEDHSGSGSSGSSGGDTGKSGSSSGGSDDGSSGSHSGGGDSSGSDDSSGSGGSGGSSGGSGSDGGGDDLAEDAVVTTSTPPPAPVEESSSGSGSSGGGSGDDFSEESRDLSSGSVSQGSDDPN